MNKTRPSPWMVKAAEGGGEAEGDGGMKMAADVVTADKDGGENRVVVSAVAWRLSHDGGDGDDVLRW
nr:hypothetical protein [Tanacetum cinerariifolium]